ncbi:small ubiquitin-related modifier 2-like [Silene latifolia]|uniref:small ubiquitin-related modifier 2-like n=1 Tax=Silene latifolia TaxID=37657 RepID=UPI003D76D3A8
MEEISNNSTEEGNANKKQKTQDFSNSIVIKFTNNTDNRTFYVTVKRTVTFRKIFEIYCLHQNVEYETARFLYEDQKILPNLTPFDINFPDGGEIDVMSYVSGGGC